jgi:hypothetical protein
MDVLVKRLTHNKLKGTIEMDDTFFKQSFKGEKGKSNKTHSLNYEVFLIT